MTKKEISDRRFQLELQKRMLNMQVKRTTNTEELKEIKNEVKKIEEEEKKLKNEYLKIAKEKIGGMRK